MQDLKSPDIADAPAPPIEDRFAPLQRERLQTVADLNSREDISDEAATPFFGRLVEIDQTVLGMVPANIAEAISGLEYARREHVQENMLDDETEGDTGCKLILHFIDGALGVLRSLRGAQSLPSNAPLADSNSADAAAILAMAKKILRLRARDEALQDELELAEGRVETPWPPVLIIQADDPILPFSPLRGVGARVGPDVCDACRQYLVESAPGSFPAEVEKRMREIVAAADRWNSAHDADSRREGIPEIRAGFDRVIRAKESLFAAAGRTPANTAAGVLAKLLIAAPDVETFAEDFADDTRAEFVLASAALDALVLFGEEADHKIAQRMRKGLGVDS